MRTIRWRNLDLSDTVVQMSGSTCSKTRRKLPEIQDTKIQEFFYMPSSVDQLHKESTMIESEEVDDDPTADKLPDVIQGIPVSYVDSENVIDPTENKLPGVIKDENIPDIEKESLKEINVVDNDSYSLVIPKAQKQKYLYNYVVPQLVFHPLLMSYNHHHLPQHHYHYPLCYPYC